MRNHLTSALLMSTLALTPAAALAGSAASDAAGTSSEALKEQTTAEQAAATTAGQRGEFINAQTRSQTLSSNYIGAPVLIGSGEQRESVGTVAQLIFDDNDTVTGAVVDVGGFLGLGAKPVGLQWDSMQRVTQDDGVAFTTSLTREELENAPEFESQEEIASEENIDMQSDASGVEGSGTAATN